MRHRTLMCTAALVSLAAGLSGSVAYSDEAPEGRSAKTPRLYTNADLEKFGPPSPSVPTPSVVGQADWEFVQSYLDREQERLDADRRHALELEKIEAEADHTPRIFYIGLTAGPRFGFFRPVHGRPHRRHPPGPESPHGPDGLLKGEDAFPR